jgi:hypothetical protein
MATHLLAEARERGFSRREHISLTGDYIWADEAAPAEGALRPLREKPSLLAA